MADEPLTDAEEAPAVLFGWLQPFGRKLLACADVYLTALAGNQSLQAWTL